MMYSFAYFFFFLVWRTSKQGYLKIRSIVKFPYLLYEPIIRGLLPIVFCCIEADTTVLVGALFYLGQSCKMYSHLSRTLGKYIQSKMVSWPTSTADPQRWCYS